MDLLNTVQPSSGWFCVLGIKGKRVDQHLVETREEVDKLVEDFVADNWDVYFGVAKFATNANRTKDNVHLLKSFWVDIDCGEAKAVVSEETGRPDGYIDQATGLEALKAFCEKIGLPDPIVVNSGRGIHAYWPVIEELTREEWEPVARRLRDLCLTHNFYIDPVVFEPARILRVPDTYNFKDDPPNKVTVLEEAEPTSIADIRSILGVKEGVESAPKREMSELTKSLMGNYTSSFTKIMVRSVSENGCQQLLSAYKDRANLTEPRWFNALSIAKFCSDKDKAIHKLSKDHPDYDPTTTEEKIEHIKGPHGCVEFEKSNPGGCEGCQFKGRIKSPISLGKEVEEASEEDNTIVIEGEDGEEDETYVIPKYPDPYFRGKNGGVYVTPPEEDADPILVYEHDLYVVKRMYDRDIGDMIVVKVHLPSDGVREFVIESAYMSKLSDLASMLAKNGVITVGRKKAEAIAMYIAHATRNLQYKKRAEIMRKQFGWADKDSKFILGDREISADGIYHSPPSDVTKEIAPRIHTAGTFEKWKEIWSMYGREGMEPKAFAALSAFGSPLLRFTGQSGALINLVHADSGTGKSTVLFMINSVYGHPKDLCGTPKDTSNSLYKKLGIYNHLCFTQDEITNLPAKMFSDFAYGVSQGKGKDRLTVASQLMENSTRWQLIGVTSSNASFYDKLSMLKDGANGELMRVLEYLIEPDTIIGVKEGRQAFDRDLMANYGHAAEPYFEYLVSNFEEVKNTVLAVQDKMDKELQLSQKERFWSAVIAANIAGGMIASRAGLIDWDMKRIYQWACSMMQDLRMDVKPPASSGMAVLGDYLNTYINNTLVVDDGVDQRSKMKALPKMEPRGELLIRAEPDTNQVFITLKHFKKNCVENQINYKDTLKLLAKEGAYIRTLNKRLSKGMKLSTPAVTCLQFDIGNSEIAKDIMNTEDDSRESTL